MRVLSVAAGVVLLLAVGLGVLAPVAAAAGYAKVVGVYLFFEPLCRQDLAHSWSYHGISAALCIRCSGAYLGAAAALLWPARISLRGFATAAACAACAWSLDAVGAFTSPEPVRFAAGLGFGATLAGLTLRQASGISLLGRLLFRRG